MPYRIELSPNNRAGCKDKRCKDAADKIKKGELRFATHYDINGNQGWAYKHWGCVTPQQIKNLNDYREGQWELLEGLEDLPEDVQSKVRRACDQGHVDDEDWKWDPEVNRPGARRIIHKKKPSADVGDHEDATNETVEKATKKAKAKSKKRARGKDDEDESENELASPPKKKKTASKKVSKVKDEEEEVVQPKANEKKARKPNAKKTKQEPDIEDEIMKQEQADSEDEKPLPKKRTATKAKADAKANGKVKETATTSVKKSRTLKKETANDQLADVEDEEEAAEPPPKPAAKRGRKKKT